MLKARLRMMLVMLVSGVVVHISSAGAQSAGPTVANVQLKDEILSGRQKKTLNALVTLAIRDIPLAEALREITKQTGVEFEYGAGVLPPGKRVTMSVRNVSAESAVLQMLEGTGVGFGRRVAQHVALVALRPQGVQDSGAIAGTVVDSVSGNGVVGVTVTVQGTKNSTITGANGTFVLSNVTAGEYVVTFKLLGYNVVSRTVKVEGKKRLALRVVMAPAANMLSGVVTTATGMQRRLEVGNDISVINADSVMAVAPVATVTDLLATRVPGLMVLPSSGLPGAPSRLRLRGTSSLSTSNDPIVVIDGVRMYADQSGDKLGGSAEGTGEANGAKGIANSGGSITKGKLSEMSGPSPLDQLDPNSIATIEVFKGPSASAMYGPDAANGVIVITTKRGQPGPPRIDVSVTGGRTTLPGDWPINYYRFGHGLQSSQSGNVGGGGSRLCSAIERCAVDSLVAFQALQSSRLSPLEAGHDRGISLGVSGGRQAMTYALTGSASERNGIFRLPPFEVERFATTHNLAAPSWMRQPDTYATASGSGKVGLQIGTRSDVMLTTTMFYSTQHQPEDMDGVISGLSTQYYDVTSPVMPVRLFGYLSRVLFQALRTTNTLQATARHWEWLPVTIVGGVDLYSTDNTSVRPRGYGQGYAPVVGGALDTDTTGEYLLSRGKTLMRTLTASTVMPFSRVRVASGVNYSATSRSAFSAQTNGLPFGVMEPTQFIYQNGTGPAQSLESRSTFGWYLAPTLQLTSRLFFNPGFRLDGSSATGVRAGLSGLPKMDVSWLAVDRSNNPPLFGVLTQLRPRIAVGAATVQPKPGNSLRLFTPEAVVFTGTTTTVPLVRLTSLGNPNLRPERSREVEAGFDSDLWNGRATMTVSGYQKVRYDAIVAFPTAGSVGGNNVAANIGTIRNRGINASLSARLLDSRVLSWNVDATITQNRGTVLSLLGGKEQVKIDGGSNDVDGRGAIVFRPGYPPNAIFVPRIASYFDANGDGRISKTEVVIADDSIYMGSQEPADQLDIRTGIILFNGRLQFTTALSYQNGMTQYNQIGLGALEGLNDPSIPLGRQAEIMAACQPIVCGGGNRGSQAGAYQRVNLIRWQSVSISWHVPGSLAARVGGSAMTVAFQGSNLGLHTNYRGKDPAVSRYTAGNLVADSGQLPAPRVFQVRLTWQR